MPDPKWTLSRWIGAERLQRRATSRAPSSRRRPPTRP